MRTVYVDTGAFIALVWRRDRDHGRVTQHLHELRAAGDRLVTSDPVIGETATRLRYDEGLAPALRFHEVIAAATTAGSLVVRESDAVLRQRAFEVMGRYDGLILSYADAVGAVVARESRADAVFGLDDDFRVLGFALEPG